MTDRQPNDTQMAAPRIFRASYPTIGGAAGRLGTLQLPGRKPIKTPNYTPVASRGAIPHVTPDNLSNYAPSVDSVYMPLEEFIEKKQPPVLNTPRREGSSLLHGFTSFPQNVMIILAARRCPAVVAGTGNTSKHLPVFTSMGFRNITVAEYASFTSTLQPDITVPFADLLYLSATPASKRLVRMTERTEGWLDEFLQGIKEGIKVFAPVLPVEYSIQWDYLRHLEEDVQEKLHGLAVYDVNLLPDLANHKSLTALPKLSLDPPDTPHDILRQVALGIDLILTPFINSTSDAGVALTCRFPPPTSAASILPLGEDMWSSDNKMSLKPLFEDCTCYACTSHHRAFLTHLLNAKEMLAWSLLQIHNYHVLDSFFAGIRASLAAGTFEEDAKRFQEVYDIELPVGTGERPRARGYHFKSEFANEKYNKPAWKADNGVVDVRVDTPGLVPEEEGKLLEEKGFAEKQA